MSRSLQRAFSLRHPRGAVGLELLAEGDLLGSQASLAPALAVNRALARTRSEIPRTSKRLSTPADLKSQCDGLLVIPLLVVLDLLLDLLLGQSLHPQVLRGVHHVLGDARHQLFGLRDEVHVEVLRHFVEAVPRVKSGPIMAVPMRARRPSWCQSSK